MKKSMKREELAGVRVDNCDLREVLREVDAYLGTAALNTVEVINMRTVVSAGEDGNVRQCLEIMDLVIPADREILYEMGIVSEQRMNEAQVGLLFHEIMEMAMARGCRLYLFLADHDQEKWLRDLIADAYGKGLEICGSYCMEDSGGDPEDAVNEINSVVPDVILSALPTPEQERFIFRHRHMLNAKLWFGIGAESDLLSAGNTPGRLYRKMLERHRMKRQIQSYDGRDDVL